MNGDAFNEGVGHGGIVVNLIGGASQAGVIIDPWTVDPETMKILQPDQYGTTIKKMGRLKNVSASGTAQLPTANSGLTPSPIVVGQYFVDPLTELSFWVSKANEAYQSGQFWKQEIECEQKLN
ncbi:MAG: hypothetical protein KGL39_21705 [Patescibacteria group bacterium]|nr:hypothetical protein [Patescibacteria group bacterium]